MNLEQFRMGLGQLGQGFSQSLFSVPGEVSRDVDPQTVQALRKQAMLQLGLGLLAAKDRGAGLGSGLAFGLNQAQQGLGQGLGQAYGAKRAQREETRLGLQEQRLDLADTRQQAVLESQGRAEERGVAERAEDVEYRNRQAEAAAAERAADNERQDRELQLRLATLEQGAVPSGYRRGASGLEAIPGGPADPTGPNMRKGSQPLRKEFRSLPSVKDYEVALPIYKSATKAPDTGYGDLQLIYSVGKLLDPGSVVREGELALTVAAGSPLQRAIGTTRFTIEKGGRLPPKSRQQIMAMLDERVGAYKQAYDRDFSQYGEYATEQNLDPELIVGKHAESAYAPKEKAVRVSNEADYAKLEKGTRYIAPDGQMRVKQ